MNQAGMTPVAAALSDLAAVYSMNRGTVETVVRQVGTDLEGTPAPPRPAADGAAPGARAAPTAQPVTTQPYSGLFGGVLTAGAAAVGSRPVAQRLAPAGVLFDAHGRAVRVIDASVPALSSPASGVQAQARPPAPGATTPVPGTSTAAATAGGRHASDRIIGHHRVPTPTPSAAAAYFEGAVVQSASPPPGPSTISATGAVTPATSTALAGGMPMGGPMVPPGGHAGSTGNYGGGHYGPGGHVPAWLVQSEDIWGGAGEIQFTASLIGEPPSATPSLRAPRLL